MIISLLTLPFFSIFFNIPILGNLGELVLIIFLTIVGFIAVGTLFAAMSVGLKQGEMMLPLLVFPIEVPVIIAAVKATGMVLDGSPLVDYSMWLKILCLFDIIYLTAAFVTFDYLIEE
jgi:heme exporter protein B